MSWIRRPARPLSVRLATPLLVLAALFVGAHASAGAADASSLAVGQSLAAGNALASPAGTYQLTLQTDGNLVLYGTTALWSTGTRGTSTTSMVLQGDGNLVLYTAAGVATWNSGTRGSGATSLVVQDDGNLVLYGPKGAVWASNTRQATPTPAPTSIGDRLPSGGSLTTARFLTSPSGAYTLTLTGGALVLSQGTVRLWTSTNSGGPGTSAVLQGDGNLVLYGASGAVWFTGTRGSGATQLVLQDDGNLVLYGPKGAVWYTSTNVGSRPSAGADRLAPGQTMYAGDSITAVGGKYQLLQQGDGNLVVYGPSGPTWSANSRGWPTVRTTLQTDGNLVVYSGAGLPLYNTGTRTGTANVLIMQGDGNLVLYGPSGALWSSFYSPAPPVLFPPVTAPPPTSTSHYLRGLRGTSADVTTMQSMGCTDARANPAGSKFITFLAFGAQASNVAGSWGVQLTASTLRITNGAVVAATNAYVDGYTSCMSPASWLTVSVGTNNDGEEAGLGQTGGQIWAQQIVNPIAAYAAGRQVTVAGANDMEPGFNGSADQARAWMGGFLNNSPAPFVWTGSADGCPQSGPSNASCNYGWTPRTLYDLTYGASAGRSLPLPQIYYTSQAKQWVNISQIGQIQWGQRIQYAGPLTEVVACAQAKSCYSMGAVDAWNTFWNLLNANSATRQTDLPYTTDIRIDY